jgi:hypothetical protein
MQVSLRWVTLQEIPWSAFFKHTSQLSLKMLKRWNLVFGPGIDNGKGFRPVGQAGGNTGLLRGEYVLQNPDFRTRTCGGKAHGLLVQVLLQFAIRIRMILLRLLFFTGCHFFTGIPGGFFHHPWLIGDFAMGVNWKKRFYSWFRNFLFAFDVTLFMNDRAEMINFV